MVLTLVPNSSNANTSLVPLVQSSIYNRQQPGGHMQRAREPHVAPEILVWEHWVDMVWLPCTIRVQE